MNRVAKMKRIGTKICSLFLALVMLCTMQNMPAFAGTGDTSASQTEGDLQDQDLTIEQRRKKAKEELAAYQADQKSSCKQENQILWDWTILNTGTDIDNAQSKDDVQAKVNSAKNQIDKIISGSYEQELTESGDYDTQVRTAKSDLAVAELKEYKAKFDENDYFSSDWTTLEMIVTAALSNFKTIAQNKKIASNTKEAIKSIDLTLENAKKDMDNVPDKTDPAAIALEEMKVALEEYKEKAIAEINRDYTSKLGNYPNKMQYGNLKKKIDDAIYEIKRVYVAEGENVSSGTLGIYTKRIDILVAQLKDVLDNTMKLYDAANLAGVKTKARKELDNYKDPKNYRAAQQKELENAIAAGKEEIKQAKTKEAVEKALKDAKAKIDKIKTNAQLKKEEADKEPTATTKKVSPKKTSILGKIQAQKRGFTVKWKKQTKDVGGYEVSYSTSRKFTEKTTVTKRIGKKTATKLTVRKLKAKKKYYVRVRTYKTVKGKKYVSSWSAVKTVVTKK